MSNVSRVIVSGRFAAAPKLLVESPQVSDRAVRLWLMLYLEGFKSDADAPALLQEEMAEWLQCSESSVKRALKELIDIKLLFVQHRKSWRGQEASIYHLTMIPGRFEYDGVYASEGAGRSPVDPTCSSPVNPTSLPKELKDTGAQKVRARNLVFEALCEVSGIDWNHSNSAELGPINKACKILRAMDPQPTPEEIHARADQYKKDWNHLTFTAMGLVTHWSKFAPIREITPETEVAVIDHQKVREAFRAANAGEAWYHPATGVRHSAADHPRFHGLLGQTEGGSDLTPEAAILRSEGLEDFFDTPLAKNLLSEPGAF